MIWTDTEKTKWKWIWKSDENGWIFVRKMRLLLRTMSEFSERTMHRMLKWKSRRNVLYKRLHDEKRSLILWILQGFSLWTYSKRAKSNTAESFVAEMESKPEKRFQRWWINCDSQQQILQGNYEKEILYTNTHCMHLYSLSISINETASIWQKQWCVS